MVNAFATTVQNFVRKLWKLTELLIVNFWYLNHNFQQCNICIILAVSTLRYNDVIINKNHGTSDWRQNFN